MKEIYYEKEKVVNEKIEQAWVQLGKAVAGIVTEIILASKSPEPRGEAQKSEELLTAVELACLLKVSKAKAYQLIQRGEIPAIQFGRVKRVRRQDLEKFIVDHVTLAINRDH